MLQQKEEAYVVEQGNMMLQNMDISQLPSICGGVAPFFLPR